MRAKEVVNNKLADDFYPFKEVRAFKKKEDGSWYLNHKGPDGKRIQYSTRVSCSRRQIEDHIKQAKLPELIRAGEATVLSKEFIDRVLIGKSYCMTDAVKDWEASLATVKDRTRKAYLTVINKFMTKHKLSGLSPRDVTEQHVYDWLNRKADLKYSSRKLEKAAISSMFTWLRNKGFVSHNPAKARRIIDLSRITHKQRETSHAEVITEPEIKKILDYLQSQRKRYGSYLRSAGCG